MSKQLKTIHVAEETWRKLMELKLKLKLRSMDEVVRWLLAHSRVRALRRKGGGER